MAINVNTNLTNSSRLSNDRKYMSFNALVISYEALQSTCTHNTIAYQGFSEEVY